MSNTRYAVALANAYNSWILKEFLEEGDRFISPILVAPQKPDRAAEEIDRRADEDGFVGVGIMLGGLGPPIGNHEYTPIFEAASDHDLPIVMHPGISGSMFGRSIHAQWIETFTEAIAVRFPFQLMWNLTSLNCQGVPERFPDLEFVFQEGGVTWLAYMSRRLDIYYLEKGEELPYLRRQPSSYVEKQCYLTTQPLEHTQGDPVWLAKAIELVGPHSVMYSSDLPHSDWDPTKELFNRIQSQFDQETVRTMMGESAADVFRLDAR